MLMPRRRAAALHEARPSGESAGRADGAAGESIDDASSREALQIPESLTPVPISTGQFKLEQAADPVCRQLIEELASLGDGARSVRLKKFSLIDGVLFRTTEADDPKEGYDSARIYVPQSLVSRVIRNHH